MALECSCLFPINFVRWVATKFPVYYSFCYNVAASPVYSNSIRLIKCYFERAYGMQKKGTADSWDQHHSASWTVRLSTTTIKRQGMYLYLNKTHRVGTSWKHCLQVSTIVLQVSLVWVGRDLLSEFLFCFWRDSQSMTRSFFLPCSPVLLIWSPSLSVSLHFPASSTPPSLPLNVNSI